MRDRVVLLATPPPPASCTHQYWCSTLVGMMTCDCRNMHVCTVCDTITLKFRSVFIEQFDHSTVVCFMYCVGTVAEWNDSVGYRAIRQW